jgi:hypothetical protein
MMKSTGINKPEFQTYDYVIGGKLVVGRVSMDETFAEILGKDIDAKKRLKEKLVHDLATYMLENQLVEFTQHDDPVTFNKTIAVRAYLAPNDQVKILRLANKIL